MFAPKAYKSQFYKIIFEYAYFKVTSRYTE